MDLFKQLAVFNRITFFETNHSYAVDGLPTNAPSVTQLLKRFKTKFDKEAISARVAKKLNVTQAQVLADWEENNLFSTTLGTIVHKYIENFYSNKKQQIEANLDKLGFDNKQKLSKTLPVLFEQFQNFYDAHQHILCVKSEMVLGDIDDTKICGMMDMLAYNTKTNDFEILDFKTNKKITKESSYGKLMHPYEDLYQGEFNEYSIQLNTYKYIIEKYTNCKVNKLRLLWLNSNNSNYELIDLPLMQDRIETMFNVYKSASLFEER